MGQSTASQVTQSQTHEATQNAVSAPMHSQPLNANVEAKQEMGPKADNEAKSSAVADDNQPGAEGVDDASLSSKFDARDAEILSSHRASSVYRYEVEQEIHYDANPVATSSSIDTKSEGPTALVQPVSIANVMGSGSTVVPQSQPVPETSVMGQVLTDFIARASDGHLAQALNTPKTGLGKPWNHPLNPDYVEEQRRSK